MAPLKIRWTIVNGLRSCYQWYFKRAHIITVVKEHLAWWLSATFCRMSCRCVMQMCHAELQLTPCRDGHRHVGPGKKPGTSRDRTNASAQESTWLTCNWTPGWLEIWKAWAFKVRSPSSWLESCEFNLNWTPDPSAKAYSDKRADRRCEAEHMASFGIGYRRT